MNTPRTVMMPDRLKPLTHALPEKTIGMTMSINSNSDRPVLNGRVYEACCPQEFRRIPGAARQQCDRDCGDIRCVSEVVQSFERRGGSSKNRHTHPELQDGCAQLSIINSAVDVGCSSGSETRLVLI